MPVLGRRHDKADPIRTRTHARRADGSGGAAAGLTAVAPPTASATTSYAYVNMGDSLSAGEGTYPPYQSGTNNAGTNMCHWSTVSSYSAGYVATSIIPYGLVNVACSGAGVDEIFGSDNPDTGAIPDAGESAQDSALSPATRLVTISIGINDLNLIGFATNCYEQLGQGNEDSCFQGMLNTAHSLLNTLNATIKTEVAKYPDFILVDESNALAGHDVCSSAPWANQINGVTLTNQTPDDESLHPTLSGYSAMAAVLRERLDAGYFSNGSAEQDIQFYYQADGGLGTFGYPFDNGGGPYARYWSLPGENVEDFTGGSAGPAIFVDGPHGVAYYVNGGFRTSYITGGYAKTCLAPTDNAYAYAGGTRQDFVNCYMTWTSSGGVVVHGPNPTSCTDYGGSTETGPNACVGFHTAPPQGKPASGNVWFSSHAHYHFCGTGDGCADGYVNQNNYNNAWATIGTICTTDGTATIMLADNGGDAYPAQVGADAIRAVHSGIAC
jgi:hypothetical protein